jgi:hypothetical protein
MNIDLRRMIIHEAMEQYEAFGRAKLATEAEKTLARIKVSECKAMLDELGGRDD